MTEKPILTVGAKDQTIIFAPACKGQAINLKILQKWRLTERLP
jgi:hypothetical protein